MEDEASRKPRDLLIPPRKHPKCTPVESLASPEVAKKGDVVDESQPDFSSPKVTGGVEQGHEAEWIFGAARSSEGKLFFIIKWIDSEIIEFVPSEEARLHCPQAVIKFYEGKIKWHHGRTLEEMLGGDKMTK